MQQREAQWDALKIAARSAESSIARPDRTRGLQEIYHLSRTSASQVGSPSENGSFHGTSFSLDTAFAPDGNSRGLNAPFGAQEAYETDVTLRDPGAEPDR